MTNDTEKLNNTDMEKYFFRASAQGFMKIPGSPVAYWIDEGARSAFKAGKALGEIVPVRQGLATADNDQFIRLWHEVSKEKTGLGFLNREDAKSSNLKWFPYNKGGDYRKWYGNNEYLVNWEADGRDLDRFKPRAVIRNPSFYFKMSITWSFVSSAYFGVRFSSAGAIFDVGGSSVFPSYDDIYWLTGFLCSKQSFEFMKIMNPTLNFQVGNVASLPILKESIKHIKEQATDVARDLISRGKVDWDSYETSWDFTQLPLIATANPSLSLQENFQALRATWQASTLEMQRLEEENNRIFIEAYGLQDEVTPDVPLEEITLTCNPHYRYKLGKQWDEASEEGRTQELEARLLYDTLRELVSYAVGCMFGRYSLDKEGLVLANQGDTLEDYLTQIPQPSFMPDDDNVIPVLDDHWFKDDIVDRFTAFIKHVFGDAHYQRNMEFIEQGLNIKAKKNFSLREYFLKDFYTDHVQTYKKRPIYWQFSSPKGSFNALVYMHRLNKFTVSKVLEYLREFKNEKLPARKNQLEAVTISVSSSPADKTRALKEIDTINKMLHELDSYERDVIYPLATQQIGLELDDGVKQNYLKFGVAVKKIAGLESKDD